MQYQCTKKAVTNQKPSHKYLLAFPWRLFPPYGVAFLDQTPTGMAFEKRLAWRKNWRGSPENLFMRWLLISFQQAVSSHQSPDAFEDDKGDGVYEDGAVAGQACAHEVEQVIAAAAAFYLFEGKEQEGEEDQGYTRRIYYISKTHECVF
jgi:hypothetical protein